MVRQIADLTRAAPPMVGAAACMEHLRSLIAAVSRRTCTVLVVGESGTGKELVARHIHANSARASGPFVPVDCTTLHDTLLESQLFGYTKGAFTGAEQATLGLFRAADDGTLFLDEIGELSPRSQAKLLRCIQEAAVVPLGGVEAIPVDVRIIAATHRDLEQMVRDGQFRADLFFRLNVVQIEVPPLRDRRGDVVALAEAFLEQQAQMYQETPKQLSADTMAALVACDWPGNVRQLANAVERAFVLSGSGVITAEDLPDGLRPACGACDEPVEGEILPLETAERLLITRALQATGGHQARAAALLQIERHRLARKMRRYGL
jgi:transcriptional regulator with PAS, ATPase and Fis domain